MDGASDQTKRGAPPLDDDALEQINRWWTISRIVTNASHDLNNALQIITGNVEMIRSKGALDPALDRRASSINDQAIRAAAIVERLLSYARSTTAAVQRIDLFALAVSALALRSVTLSRARIATSLTRADDAPYWVAIDPQEGLQLLLNLLLDAERRLVGQTAAKLSVDLARSGGSIVCAVEEFAESWTEARDAAPVLAAFVMNVATPRLASRNGGDLDVDERAGGGRRVTLTLPSI
jgi:signal transduction histidine kinase